MSNERYTAVGGVAREVKKRYTVVGGVAREVKKRYTVVGGITRLCYSGAPEASYTGAYTTSDVTVGGVDYTLWTLTQSGTLTVNAPMRYWMCGGGANSRPAVDSPSGGGGGAYAAEGTIDAGTHVITVAAAAGKSIIGSATAAPGGGPGVPRGGSGGSGGGSGGGFTTSGTGDGKSKYPFGVSALRAHCAGGGGGALRNNSSASFRTGCAGGTNGGNGGESAYSSADTVPGGAGGSYGGGKGGNATRDVGYNGGSGSFYGAGGGGGGYSVITKSAGSGGAGYQGVVYILVPKSA